MPFKKGQSELSRANAEALHHDSMDAADAYGVVINGRPGPRWFNYQVQLCVTPRGTWIACWTQGASESFSDQRVVAARSTDNGKTWSKELVIEPACSEPACPEPVEWVEPVAGGYRVPACAAVAATSWRRPAWIVSYMVPRTGRIFMFYWYNVNGIPLRDAGDIFFRCSDDDGLSWSERFRVGVPRTAMDDIDGDIHGWNFCQPRLLSTGQVMMTYTKIKRSSLFPKGWRLDARNTWQPEPGEDPPARPETLSPRRSRLRRSAGRRGEGPAMMPKNEQGGSPNNWWTEVFIVELTNILTEPDPARLRFRFLPEGNEGLWVPYPGTDRHFGQEGTLAELSGDRMLCVFRSRRGHPFYAVSTDRGARWSKPDALRLCPGGAPFNQPCAPCPIFRLPDGRFIFLFHNAEPQGDGWHPRHPLWITVGREDPGVEENAGLSFGKPNVIIYNDGKPDGPFKDHEIGYPAFYRIAGKYYIAYANKTCQIRINEVPESLLGGTVKIT